MTAQAPPTPRSSGQAPAGAGRAAAGWSSRTRAAVARPWLLLAPALLVLAVLLLWPLVRVFLFSLQDYGLREITTGEPNWIGDRKSTRLNSSHVKISYAVFCLKKKNIIKCINK